MFLEVYNFMYEWLFAEGLPTFLTINTAEWISFGLASAVILFGLFVVSIPLWFMIKKVFDWL